MHLQEKLKYKHSKIWGSNLILSDIPWDYYLHPCPIFYAEELSKHGPTLWVNPPTRNPAKTKLIFKNKNLLIFTPIIFKRPSDDSGFGKLEVRIQLKATSLFFLGSPTSVWSISTAYPHLIKENPSAVSIFWTGDFFSPEKEYKSYKNFDLALCLTPKTHESIPNKFKGEKVHFHMCSQLSRKEKKSLSSKYVSSILEKGSKYNKTAGYVGTLSDRRVDFDSLFYLIENLPDIFFIIVGVGDGSQSTEEKICRLKSKSNVQFIEGMDYEDLAEVISEFDMGLIPYKTDHANIGTCPTKFVDYSCMGKPTISTRLPGLEKFGDLILIADSKEDFRFLIQNFKANDHSKPNDLIKFAHESNPSEFLRKFEDALAHLYEKVN